MKAFLFCEFNKARKLYIFVPLFSEINFAKIFPVR